MPFVTWNRNLRIALLFPTLDPFGTISLYKWKQDIILPRKSGKILLVSWEDCKLPIESCQRKRKNSPKPSFALFYDRKMSILIVYTSIVLSLLVIGGLLNGLEVWLIVFHSPKEMRVYSRILLQISTADVLTLVLDPLIRPVSINLSIKWSLKPRNFWLWGQNLLFFK